jgi:hypothetical protein
MPMLIVVVNPFYVGLTFAEAGLERGPLAAEAARDRGRLPAEDITLMGAISVSSASDPAYMTEPPASSKHESFNKMF